MADQSSVKSTSRQHSHPQDADRQHDAATLEATGHSQELVRQFSSWSMFALSFTVLGTWSTISQNMSDGVTRGGPVAILWGLVLVTLCNLCAAVSLGELLSAMPTAMGQAYWVYRLWPTPTGRFMSYMCAWITTFGWWTITASQAAFMTEFILGLKLLRDPDWAPAGYSWVQFLLYVGICFFLSFVNAVACRADKILAWINSAVGIMFFALFLAFALALLISTGAKSNLNYQPASFVFGRWINETGWSDGVVWFSGLVQAAYGLTAFDACIHMVEELKDPEKTGPRIIWQSVLVGAASGWLFMMVCLFCIQGIDGIVDADNAFIALCQSTIGTTGSIVLLALFVINGLGQNLSLVTTASRLTWSFARDGGVPFHVYFAKVDPTWKAPVRANWLQGGITALIGVLYLFANTVLSAILSVSTIALTISYAMPITALLIAGRQTLPQSRAFHLGRYGMPCNIVALIYCSITTVFFFFPETPSPATADMNWAIAVFGVMLVIALGFWLWEGRKSYLETDTATFGIVDDGGLTLEDEPSASESGIKGTNVLKRLVSGRSQKSARRT